MLLMPTAAPHHVLLTKVVDSTPKVGGQPSAVPHVTPVTPILIYGDNGKVYGGAHGTKDNDGSKVGKS